MRWMWILLLITVSYSLNADLVTHMNGTYIITVNIETTGEVRNLSYNLALMNESNCSDIGTKRLCHVESSMRIVNGSFTEYPVYYSNDYTKPGRYTNLGEDVCNTAKDVVKGATTIEEAAAKVCLWVNSNMNYTEKDGHRNASYILQTKKGVCRDYATLTVAMLRCLGIGARYVSGYAHSDIYPNAVHSWVEYYDPKIGWIEIDPTYGECSYVDGTHVKAISTFEVDDKIVEGTYYGEGSVNIDINTSMENMSVELSKSRLDVDLEMDKQNYGSEDHAVIVANITNKYNSTLLVQYKVILPTEVHLAYGDEEGFVEIGPNDNNYVVLIAKLPKTVDRDYYIFYNVPIGMQIADKVIYKNITLSSKYMSQTFQQAYSKLEEIEATKKGIRLVINAPNYTYNNEVPIEVLVYSKKEIRDVDIFYLNKREHIPILTGFYKLNFTVNLTDKDNYIKVLLSPVNITYTKMIYKLDKPNITIKTTVNGKACTIETNTDLEKVINGIRTKNRTITLNKTGNLTMIIIDHGIENKFSVDCTKKSIIRKLIEWIERFLNSII
ncbi:hypothetical protein DRN75_00775 [Nanoarchaeota archaeon]|nr:MAG: hypothetical protein DRN75_00775 [Nanoarchaeota archaeon]